MMGAFLRAIREAPEEDIHRLIFADWLDEHGQCDRDRATAEFIRVSCDRKNRLPTGRAMPALAYKWLDQHWPRLVPSAFPLHRQEGTSRKLFLRRFGRVVSLRLCLWVPQTDKLYRTYSCELHFWKGFVLHLVAWSPIPREALEGALRVDQPILFLESESNG